MLIASDQDHDSNQLDDLSGDSQTIVKYLIDNVGIDG